MSCIIVGVLYYILLLFQIIEKGHSRIPIYKGERKNICGLLLVKKLIQLDPEDCTPIQTLKGAQMPPPSCMTTMPLYQLLNHFQTGRSKSNTTVGVDMGVALVAVARVCSLCG